MCKDNLAVGSDLWRGFHRFSVIKLEENELGPIKKLMDTKKLLPGAAAIGIDTSALETLESDIVAACAVKSVALNEGENAAKGKIIHFDQVCLKCDRRVSGEILKVR